MPGRVAVVGGGVAGIAAAICLAGRGASVSLIERTNRLGGRAGSFRDPALDESIDNCQHVALGCCDHYLGLLRDLGMADAMEWTSSFHYIESDGRTTTLPIPAWPSPLHGLPLLLNARFLTITDRLSIARALAGVRLQRPDAWAGRSFAEWLKARRQPRSAVERFWTPIVVSACNARPEHCDAAAAIKVFRDGFLRSHADARMGVPRVPLAELYAATGEILERAGGELRLNAQAVAVDSAGVMLRAGERIEADAVVLATPFAASADLLDASPIDAAETVNKLRDLSYSPIVAVHAEFQQPVTDLPHAVLLDADFDWLFFKDTGRRVHAVASAAEALASQPADELVSSLVREVRDRFGVAEAPVWARAVKERRATFLVSPDSARCRPAVDELAPAVWIAGDFTATGWPATMEGATQSGQQAADLVSARLGATTRA